MNAPTETEVAKAAVVIFSDTETHGDLARAVNALETVKEFKEAGDEVVLIFDGSLRSPEVLGGRVGQWPAGREKSARFAGGGIARSLATISGLNRQRRRRYLARPCSSHPSMACYNCWSRSSCSARDPNRRATSNC